MLIYFSYSEKSEIEIQQWKTYFVTVAKNRVADFGEIPRKVAEARKSCSNFRMSCSHCRWHWRGCGNTRKTVFASRQDFCRESRQNGSNTAEMWREKRNTLLWEVHWGSFPTILRVLKPGIRGRGGASAAPRQRHQTRCPPWRKKEPQWQFFAGKPS